MISSELTMLAAQALALETERDALIAQGSQSAARIADLEASISALAREITELRSHLDVPVIASFTVAPAALKAPGTVKIAWDADADAATLNGETVALKAERNVNVTEAGSVAYKLVAERDGMSVDASAGYVATGTVVPPPPPPPPSGDTVQYLTWDAGSGPSIEFWSRHLWLSWKNKLQGDWIDANGQAQGPAPFASVPVDTAAKWYEVDLTALVAKAVTSGKNKGFMLRSARTSSVTISGRVSPNPPQLIIGTVPCKLLAFSTWATSTSRGIDSRASVKIAVGMPGILQFDLSTVKGPVASAKLRLYCEASVLGNSVTVDVYEVDAPLVVVGAGSTAPTPGLAIEVGGDAKLKGHPDVIAAGDFGDLTHRGTVFTTTGWPLDAVPEQLPDPDAPGTIMLRNAFRAGLLSEGGKRGSFHAKVEVMRADAADLLMPIDVKTRELELFCRLYFFLENDWNSTRDGNKMALGWDLRFGWWNKGGGGYWQSTTGNGGGRGSGLKKKWIRTSSTGNTTQWLYEGHSIRMEAGKGQGDGNPYEQLRPIQSYVYNLDQPTAYGDMLRLGTACITKNRWHCIEQQLKVNTISGPFDAVGNGTANPDGVLRTWLDGVLCSEVTNLRWHRHPDMGIQGSWINWYYGGGAPSEIPMHYRMNHFVLARRYIGPRVA